jgi:hypothetical protein
MLKHFLVLWTSISGVRKWRDDLNRVIAAPHFPALARIVETNVLKKKVGFNSSDPHSPAELREALESVGTPFIDDITSLAAGKVSLISKSNQEFKITYQWATTATQVYGGRTVDPGKNGCRGCSNVIVSVFDPKWGEKMCVPLMLAPHFTDFDDGENKTALIREFVLAPVPTIAPSPARKPTESAAPVPPPIPTEWPALSPTPEAIDISAAIADDKECKD